MACGAAAARSAGVDCIRERGICIQRVAGAVSKSATVDELRVLSTQSVSKVVVDMIGRIGIRDRHRILQLASAARGGSLSDQVECFLDVSGLINLQVAA